MMGDLHVSPLPPLAPHPPPPPPSPQRTRRPPKEMVPLKPEEFAAQLISRLESLKRQQDTLSCLEERLQQIQEVRTAAWRSLESVFWNKKR